MTLGDFMAAGLVGALILHGTGLCLLVVSHVYLSIRAYDERRIARQFEQINMPRAEARERWTNSLKDKWS